MSDKRKKATSNKSKKSLLQEKRAARRRQAEKEHMAKLVAKGRIAYGRVIPIIAGLDQPQGVTVS
jgi:hypothetical protein